MRIAPRDRRISRHLLLALFHLIFTSALLLLYTKRIIDKFTLIGFMPGFATNDCHTFVLCFTTSLLCAIDLAVGVHKPVGELGTKYNTIVRRLPLSSCSNGRLPQSTSLLIRFNLAAHRFLSENLSFVIWI